MISLAIVAIALWQLLTFQTSIIDLVGMDIIQEFTFNFCAGLVIAFLLTYAFSLTFFVVGFSTELVYHFLIKLCDTTLEILTALFNFIHRIIRKSSHLVHDIFEKSHGIKSAASSPAPLTTKKSSLKDNGSNDTKVPPVLKFSPIVTVEIVPEAKALTPAAAHFLITSAQAISISIYLILIGIYAAIITIGAHATLSICAACVQLFEVVTAIAKSCLQLLCSVSICIIRYIKTTATLIKTCSQALCYFTYAMFTIIPTLLGQKTPEKKTPLVENIPMVELEPVPVPVEENPIVPQEPAIAHEEHEHEFIPAVHIYDLLNDDGTPLLRRRHAKPKSRARPPPSHANIPVVSLRRNGLQQAKQAQLREQRQQRQHTGNQLYNEENFQLHREITSLRLKLEVATGDLKSAEIRNNELVQIIQESVASQDTPAQPIEVEDTVTSPQHRGNDQFIELNVLKEEIAKVKEQNTQMNAEVATLKQHNQNLLFGTRSKVEYAELETKYAQLKTEHSTQMLEYEDLYNRHMDMVLGDGNDDATTPLAATAATSSAVVDAPTVITVPPTVADSPTITTPDLDLRDAVISELKEQIGMLEASLKSAPSTDMIVRLKEANQELLTDLNTYKNKSPGKVQLDTTEIDRLQTKITELEQNAVQHSLNMINVRTDLQCAEQKLVAFEANIQSADEKLTVSDATIQKYTAIGQSLEAAHKELGAELARTQAELIQVNEKLKIKIQEEEDSAEHYSEIEVEWIKTQAELVTLRNTVEQQNLEIVEKDATIEANRQDILEGCNDLAEQRKDHADEISKLTSDMNEQYQERLNQQLKQQSDEQKRAYNLQFNYCIAQQRSADAINNQAIQAQVNKQHSEKIKECEETIKKYQQELDRMDKCLQDKDQEIADLEAKMSVTEQDEVDNLHANGEIEAMKQELQLKIVGLNNDYNKLKEKTDEAATHARRSIEAVTRQRDHEWTMCRDREAQIDDLRAQLQAGADQGALAKIEDLQRRLQHEEVQHRITADRAAKDRELRGVAERKVTSLEKQLNTA